MTSTTNGTDEASAEQAMGTFEKWLSVWVGLAILAGLILGSIVPALFGLLAAVEISQVNL